MSFKTLVFNHFPFLQGLKTACLGELKQPVYEKISLAQYCRYVKDFVIYGVTPQEYDFFRFNELSRRGKNEFITYTRSGQLNDKYNSKESYSLLNNKWAFNEHFKKFIKRHYMYLNENSKIEDLKNFIAKLNGAPFLSKPLDSSYGRGITIGYTYEDLLSLRGRGGNFIIEEKLCNDVSLSILNNSSLNTLRVVTCIDKESKIHVACILLRTGCKGKIIDNLLGGGTCYHIDIETGVIDCPGRDKEGNNYVCHPSSGIVMPGYKIHNIDAIVLYCKELAAHLPDARIVGWDIAVTSKGYEVIEGNARPSAELIQCNGKGLYKMIIRLLES